MNAKKGITIGLIIFAIVAIFVFVYMWSLGVFSGSALIGDRNPVVEQAVNSYVADTIKETFSGHEELNLVDAKAYSAMYASEYPLDKYFEGSVFSDEVLEKAMRKKNAPITIELTFEGKSLAFNEYKVLVYKIVETIRDKMDWAPLNMQVFYNRIADKGESENVLQYESKVPWSYFEEDQKTVVNASGVHFIVEVDETLESKVKWYYGIKDVYLVVVSITVIALTTLLIVRTVRKKRRYKK
ncbi:MAG: hypothetical protein E7388_06700 [Ruminococcaceae bacterium]|nr:hypothetical protein [Oscillospiraceae bacterium]